MRINVCILIAIAFASVFAKDASASLVTFEITGTVRDRNTGQAEPLRGSMTIETNVSANPGGGSDFGSFDFTAPGTGLSVDVFGKTYFASSVQLNLRTNFLSTSCDPFPTCDSISILAGPLGQPTFVTFLFEAPDPLGLSAPTLNALATEDLSNFRDIGRGFGGIVLHLPDRIEDFGILDKIVRVPEPASFALFGMGLIGLLTARRKTKQKLFESSRA